MSCRAVVDWWAVASTYGEPVLLGAGDALPVTPARVLVAGTSGSGKTTLARRLTEMLAIPYVELDALFHGPGWVPRESFVADVEAFSSRSEWVTEWQYAAVRELLAQRADLMVWLDLGRATVMGQVVVRTLRRRLGRQVLWNGNREPPLWTIVTNPEHIVRWAWSSHRRHAPRILDLHRRRPELPIVRLRHRREIQHWLDGLAGSRIT